MTFTDFNLTKNADGLLPVIIQDNATLRVLMLGYMNEEAFLKTQESGLVTFYSRSRQTLWTKGETSNNFLHVVEMYADCDADTLLIKARPDGPTCHRGTTACWDTPAADGFLGELEQCVQQRHRDMPLGSYTTYLFEKGINRMAQKVGEEALEAVIEAVNGTDDRLLYEASDMFYHLIVLLASKGLRIEQVAEELAERHRPGWKKH